MARHEVGGRFSEPPAEEPSRGGWLARFPWGTFGWFASQTVLVIVVLAFDHFQTIQLKTDYAELEIKYNTINEGGSAALSLLAQRISVNEGNIQRQEAALQSLQRAQIELSIAESREIGKIDLMNVLLGKIEEQQNRIGQALDNTYSMLNEHLRNSNGPSNGSVKSPPPVNRR